METVIAIVIVLILVFLCICTWRSWALVGQNEGDRRYVVGGVATTLITLVGFWFVFFSGVLS
jgi:regulator of protease activity HflC (stomatin/prohibitin superfamily)